MFLLLFPAVVEKSLGFSGAVIQPCGPSQLLGGQGLRQTLLGFSVLAHDGIHFLAAFYREILPAGIPFASLGDGDAGILWDHLEESLQTFIGRVDCGIWRRNRGRLLYFPFLVLSCPHFLLGVILDRPKE